MTCIAQPSISPESPEPHELHCMEVWGGSSAADHAATVPGLDISVNAMPVGGEMGGDLYLISSCSSGWISRMLLADVAGHGQGVSELSNKLRRAMHKSINTVDQSKLARTLNEAFDQISHGERFATALLMTYFAPSGHLVLVNAGHPPPLLKRSGGAGWEPIVPGSPGVISQTSRRVRVGITNLPLGVIASTDYEQFAIEINAGDRVCAYTDAYIESLDDDGKMLGVSGFCDLLNTMDADEQDLPPASFARLVRDHMVGSGCQLADDDHTLLVFAHNGEASPSLSIPLVGNWLKQRLGLGHTDTVV